MFQLLGLMIMLGYISPFVGLLSLATSYFSYKYGYTKTAIIYAIIAVLSVAYYILLTQIGISLY